MTLRSIRFALPAVLALLMVLPSCQKHEVKALGPITITLAYNQGQCTQNGSTGTLTWNQDQDVTYVGRVRDNCLQCSIFHLSICVRKVSH